MDCQRTKSPTPHVPSWTHRNKNSGVLGNYCTVLSVLYCGLWHNVAHLRIINPSIPASLMRTRQSANNGSVLSKIISVTFAMSVTLAADASLPGRLSYEWKTVSKPKHLHPESLDIWARKWSTTTWKPKRRPAEHNSAQTQDPPQLEFWCWGWGNLVVSWPPHAFCYMQIQADLKPKSGGFQLADVQEQSTRRRDKAHQSSSKHLLGLGDKSAVVQKQLPSCTLK